MKRRVLLSAAGVLALSRRAVAQSSAPLLIGCHLDQAKQASYYSLLQRNAMDLFVKQLNDRGGVLGRPVRVLYEDDENNPVTTATKVEKLASEGVVYIVSIGSSATGLATQAKASELKIPHGAPANLAEQLTTEPPKRYYFRIPLRGKYELAAVAQYLHKTYGAPKLAIVRDGTQTGLVISDQWIADLKKDGFAIVALEQITPGLDGGDGPGAAGARRQSGCHDRGRRVDSGSGELHQGAQAVRPAFTADRQQRVHRGRLSQAGRRCRGGVRLSRRGRSGAAGDQGDRPAAGRTPTGPNLGNQAVALQAWEYMRLVADAITRAGGDDREKIRDAMEATHGWPIAIGPAGTQRQLQPAEPRPVHQRRPGCAAGGQERRVRSGAAMALSFRAARRRPPGGR